MDYGGIPRFCPSRTKFFNRDDLKEELRPFFKTKVFELPKERPGIGPSLFATHDSFNSSLEILPLPPVPFLPF